MPSAEDRVDPLPRLVVATGNAGKLGEYEELLAGRPVEVVGHDTGVEETGSTYEANARLKAGAATRATGLAAIGDDSGIEVEALDGFPGIRSARLGRDQAARTAALLRRLEGHPRPWPARFVCVIALSIPGAEIAYFRGERTGEVVPEWRGEAGFGYDPVFLLPELGRTFGELSPTLKHRWSHRGAAIGLLIDSGALKRLAIL
ncbi:MAG: RdgB/HAM1 family non-canonical purine NTP pyrophosphatase [Candidatus Dormibacteraceae bacterium]